jgi:hypothetical protein
VASIVAIGSVPDEVVPVEVELVGGVMVGTVVKTGPSSPVVVLGVDHVPRSQYVGTIWAQ